MLLIVNCKSIYGSDIPELSDALKRMGHEIAVIGGPMDQAVGDIARARSILGTENSEVADMSTVESRRSIILGLVGVKEEVLIVSDSPYDRAAADTLNIATVSPFDFDLRWVGEEV